MMSPAAHHNEESWKMGRGKRGELMEASLARMAMKLARIGGS